MSGNDDNSIGGRKWGWGESQRVKGQAMVMMQRVKADPKTRRGRDSEEQKRGVRTARIRERALPKRALPHIAAKHSASHYSLQSELLASHT